MRIAIAAAVLATACSEHPRAAPPAEPSGLELIAGGLWPRVALRYAIPKGTETELSLEVAGHAAAGDFGDASPPLHVALELAVDDVQPDGRMHLVSTIRSLTADGDDPTAAHLNELGRRLAGLAITATLAPDGAMTGVAATDRPLPDDAKAQVAQLVSDLPRLALPLPSAPVGIGAIWRITRPLDPAGPLALDAITTVALTGRDGPTVRYAIRSELRGGDQTVTEDGTTVAVRGIAGSASGGQTVNLERFALDGAQTFELHMEMTTGSDRTAMTQSQTLRVSSH